MDHTIRGYGMYIKKINDLLSREANRNLLSHNLTLSQSRMLTVLYHAPEGEHTLKELEALFQVAQSTMAGLVTRLEQKGLVACCIDPCDKRVKRVRLTDSGRAICLDARQDIIQSEARLTAQLSPEEQAQLLSLLRRVYETIQDPSI